jgi:hypothetical protein
MKPLLYSLLLLGIITLCSLAQVGPKINGERNQRVFIVVTFKDKINPKIEEKYSQKDLQHIFKESNEKLKSSNQVILVTKAKYVNKIKNNRNVSFVSKDVFEKTVKKEQDYKNYSPLMSDYSISPIWFLIFYVSSFLTITNVLIIVGLVIKRKIKKLHS